jgi:hypothetical protein
LAIYDRVMTKFVALELTANLIHFYEPLFGRFSEIASDKTFAWQTAVALCHGDLGAFRVLRHIAAIWRRDPVTALY